MNLIIADTLSEKGHFYLNLLIINWLNDFGFTCRGFFSREFSEKVKTVKCNCFEEKYLKKGFMLRYFFNQLLLHCKLLLLARKNKSDLLLLSYEIYSFSIFSYAYSVFGVKVFVIEHNTVPTVTSSMKGMLYRSISNSVCHLSLESYISEFIRDNYSKRTCFFEHPILLDDSVSENTATNIDSTNKKPYYFMPSSTVNHTIANEIIESFKSKEGSILFMKNIGESVGPNIFKMDFFEDYYNLLKNSKIIILPQLFDYRVSGVFYETLPFDNIVVMYDCIMARELYSKYPNKIQIVNSASQITSLTFKTLTSKVDVISYNENSKKQLLDCLHG